MGYYTFVDNAVPTSSQWNANFRDQVITQCTSATRPGSPVEGQCIYETDTDRVLYYNGSTWVLGGWRNGTYTPTLSGMAIGTGGSAANNAYYAWSNGVLVVWGTVVFGTSGTTFPTSPTLSLPSGFTASVVIGSLPIGTCTLIDNGTQTYWAMTRLPSTTTVAIIVPTVSGSFLVHGGVTTTSPFTWAAGDSINWQATLRGDF